MGTPSPSAPAAATSEEPHDAPPPPSRLDVAQFRGQTGSFISPAPGQATCNVCKRVRAELLGALRSAVEAAPASPPPGDGEASGAHDEEPMR